MKERPILFSAPMVRALLEGRKTQTRRCSNFDEINRTPGDFGFTGMADVLGIYSATFRQISTGSIVVVKCPYGQPSDRLWVKETFYESGHSYQTYPEDDEWHGWAGSRDVRFVADGFPECRGAHAWGDDTDNEKRFREGRNFFPDRGQNYWRKKPSIYMPRWASRIILEILTVRVERVQEITWKDAVAEGIRTEMGSGMIEGETCYMMTTNSGYMRGPMGAVCAYRDLWTSINGPGSWALNPWVWVVEFKRVEVSK